jgi:acetyltransferase-like isoleucine patch superfamily enzyme
LNGKYASGSKKMENIRNITWQEKLKLWRLKFRYGKAVHLNGIPKIIGKLPVFKLPGKGKIILGHKVVLNSDFRNSNTALTYRCTLVCGLQGIIEIGDSSQLNGVAITAYKKVTIGKNCQIASSTFITDTDFHPVDPEIRLKEVLGHKIDYSHVAKQEVIVGDNVWIGWGVTILKGVSIGNNSIVAAGAVVISNVPANALVAGNPATVKKIFQ